MCCVGVCVWKIGLHLSQTHISSFFESDRAEMTEDHDDAMMGKESPPA